ncbi:hypothetical protein FOA43_000617 [Brettanomyces nanus]|uniref:Uncharacterized protein n=1 Tax=Eeniella nana TaxID=13502 RepID=A0A875RTA7_EENNA|nr:uncharacterized protein FOA43_000617 [Brettanomyces nanus]QPG73307.1 hypothetical protein FOA43_000617 [Brettanomyces nanus]
MGICISCLRSYDEDTDQGVDENSPLLGDNEQQQIQAEEELQLELRNKELNSILNSANDHLIDLGTFMQSNQLQPFPGISASGLSSEQQQPQPTQDMTMSSMSHMTTGTGNGTTAGTTNGDFIKMEPVDQGEVEKEVQRDLDNLNEALGPDRMDKLTSIDTSSVGPLLVALE